MSSSLPGIKNPNAKFSTAEVGNIRRLWKAGRKTAVQIAERYGVSEQTIISLVHGKTYPHDRYKPVDTKHRLTKKGEKHPSAILSNKQVREIRRLLASGDLKPQVIGKLFGVSRHTITDIRDRRSWRHLE